MTVAPTIYTEDEAVLGTYNMWNYYFKPIGPETWRMDISPEAITDSGGGYPFDKLAFPYADSPWLLGIWDQYVRFRPETLLAIEKSRDVIEPGEDVLAVHFRGKEMRTALHHPMPPTARQIFKRIDRVLEEESYESIYLVTEGEDYVDQFRARYGSLVRTLPVARSRNSNIYEAYPRQMHRYRLGLEILTEVSLMSECGGLICGFSNVSQFAEVLSRGRFRTIDRVWNGKLRGGRLLAPVLWHYRSVTPRLLGGFAQ